MREKGGICMPTCQNCHTKWTWSQTFKKQFNLMGEMTCPYCDEKQYYSARIRKASGVIPFIIITVIMLGNLIFGPSVIALIALFLILPVYLLVLPFIIELANEEEPLF